MAQITSSITFTPNGYTNNGTYVFTASTSYPWTNAYTDSQSTTYAQLQLASSSRNARTSQVYVEFDMSELSKLPSNATINSVTCYIKYYVSSTSYVSAFSARTYTNTTAKGSNLTTRPTSATRSQITAGSWTLDELKNFRVFINATHTNSTNAAYLYLYGIDVTVNFTTTSYNVVASSESSTVTVSPTSQTVISGNDATVGFENVSDVSNIVVKDGNVDVTNSLVQSLSIEENPSSFDNSSSNPYSSSTNYNNGCTDIGSTTFATLRGRNTSNNYFYDFGGINIPTSAEVSKITLELKACRYSTYGWSGALCNGTTEISSVSITAQTSQQTTPSSSEPKIFTIENTSLKDVSNLKIKLKPTTGSTNSRLFFYGANLTIECVAKDQTTYYYTISNIQADHTITVEDASSPTVSGYVKKNSQYKSVSNTYQKNATTWQGKTITSVMWKVNGSWVKSTTSMSGRTAIKLNEQS